MRQCSLSRYSLLPLPPGKWKGNRGRIQALYNVIQDRQDLKCLCNKRLIGSAVFPLVWSQKYLNLLLSRKISVTHSNREISCSYQLLMGRCKLYRSCLKSFYIFKLEKWRRGNLTKLGKTHVPLYRRHKTTKMSQCIFSWIFSVNLDGSTFANLIPATYKWQVFFQAKKNRHTVRVLSAILKI